MQKFLLMCHNTPNDHKEDKRLQLADALEKLGIAHSIKQMWYFGGHKAVVELHRTDVDKVEKLAMVKSVCAM